MVYTWQEVVLTILALYGVPMLGMTFLIVYMFLDARKGGK